MQRGNKSKNEGKDGQVQYRKTGGGSFQIGSRIIKPNQVFWAYPSEIPAAFQDLLELVDKTITKDEAIGMERKVKGTYQLSSREDGKYDIKDANGKVLNDQPLEKFDADEMLKGLE